MMGRTPTCVWGERTEEKRDCSMPNIVCVYWLIVVHVRLYRLSSLAGVVSKRRVSTQAP